MIRKDYIAIAEALKNAREDISPNWTTNIERGVILAAEHIANAMAADNPKFDREHFLAVVRGERDLNSRPRRKQ